MDKILHHLKTPGVDASPVNTNKQGFAMVSKWCRISSTHSMSIHMGNPDVLKSLGWLPGGAEENRCAYSSQWTYRGMGGGFSANGHMVVVGTHVTFLLVAV